MEDLPEYAFRKVTEVTARLYQADGPRIRRLRRTLVALEEV
jgi:hypothetical protein